MNFGVFPFVNFERSGVGDKNKIAIFIPGTRKRSTILFLGYKFKKCISDIQDQNLYSCSVVI